jgi:hypothetical protein
MKPLPSKFFSLKFNFLMPLVQCIGVLCLIGCLWAGDAWASPLTERIAAFPQWTTKPPVQAVEGDLVYPNWFAGTWKMTSTLVVMTAPLAPEIVTPGYEGNKSFLNQPVSCQVRFVAEKSIERGKAVVPILALPIKSLVQTQIVSDRAFNGLNLAKVYLGDRVSKVWVDPRDSNRLITKSRDNRKFFSTTIGRLSEQSDPEHFTASELFDQFFQAPEKPYKNQVETTTAYTHQPDGTITADQITAVYLVPPHPKAFLAGDRPAALYRYRLELTPDR